MKLRYKILILLLSILLFLIVVQYLLVQKSILSNLHELELNVSQVEMERVVNAIFQELENLDTLALNLSELNEIYDYINGRNASQEAVNFMNNIFELLNINLVIIADSRLQIRFQKCYDYINRTELQIPELAPSNISSQLPLLNHTNRTSSVKGIVLVSSGIMLVTNRPILTHQANVPISGNLVLGCTDD